MTQDGEIVAQASRFDDVGWLSVVKYVDMASSCDDEFPPFLRSKWQENYWK
jgi:hypothetical protein